MARADWRLCIAVWLILAVPFVAAPVHHYFGSAPDWASGSALLVVAVGLVIWSWTTGRERRRALPG